MPKKRRKLSKEMELKIASAKRRVELITAIIFDINDEDIEKFMFYPFITNKKNAEGLGLTFVNLNVSKYGGYFKYERERNSSTFNLYLPLIINRSY